MILVEVQTGTYFGEDDIVRVQDDYDRPEKHIADVNEPPYEWTDGGENEDSSS